MVRQPLNLQLASVDLMAVAKNTNSFVIIPVSNLSNPIGSSADAQMAILEFQNGHEY